MATEIYFPVKVTEIDLYGVVHHAKYPKWFELGRLDFLNKAGIPISMLNTLGLFFPLVDMRCEYKSPAKLGYTVIVITELTSLSCVKLTFEYRVLNVLRRKVLATGKTSHAWTNKKFEPLNLEKAAPEIYTRLKQLVKAGRSD
ncbi:MAG: acyl-CoA thioesterase [Clostridiaceae bacterium]|nr:acyl-CoA thioesterase [Clostridiaceae bacterium]